MNTVFASFVACPTVFWETDADFGDDARRPSQTRKQLCTCILFCVP